ncbi:MAG: site-specific DNA-methyltransferase [Bacteroidetes bacterium]|nr:MAG: site-specific DNA-methyltransferase [Bacteroidota bacterium]TAG90487.1 MAG: site-specific DNA-methyltransferase [Bacteroidota bacterium]
MNQEQNITNHIKVPNKDLEILKSHFPQCFDKDGNFQLEKFKSNLTEKEINFSSESYGLDWLGKSYSRLLASDSANTLLKADQIHNAKDENKNAENLLIKGDNLEVLKHLANAYYEKVKMIYIDPPYNTGSDGFVYNDDRKFSVKELQNLIGIDEERAKRILDFTQQKSNSHSAWLTFMYPRLYVAKQLLKDDGVIFISIDDNEVAQLRLLMDEVFGEENFVVEFIWKKGKELEANNVGYHHEYVLLYAKYKNNLNLLLKEKDISRHKSDLTEPNLVEGIESEYKAGELFQLINLSKQDDYNLEIPLKGGKILTRKGYLAPSTLLEYIKTGRIFVGKKETVYVKSFLSDERDGSVISSVIESEFGTTKKGGIEQKEYFNFKPFSYPKPTLLLKHFIKTVENNSLIMDFFAGSGTTGDAVMQINAEDGGNRKFILVQIPELIDKKKKKKSYDFVKEELKAEPTIFEITKERLFRASKKINEELDKKIEKLQAQIPTPENKTEIEKFKKLQAQNYFKIFETTPIWEDYNFEADKLDNQISLLDETKLTQDDIKALLTTWKTFDGIPLTQELEPIDLSGYEAYYGNEKLYLMNKSFTTDNLKTVLEKIDLDKEFNPSSIIAFGYYFDSKNLRELSESLKLYTNKKNIGIDFITRY